MKKLGYKELFSTLLLATALTVIYSCSGGGGGSEMAGGGVGGTGFNGGAISKFGSIFVNGVEIDTSGADISVNGSGSTEDGLKAGMIVSVSGTPNADGVIESAGVITYENYLNGPISQLDASKTTLTIMGQTVVTDDLTIFENAEFSDLAVGSIVEVSGLADASGTITATWVGFVKSAYEAGDTLSVKGTVGSLDTTAATFKINGLTVNYSGASFQGMEAVSLADGIFVCVKSDTTISGSTMTASMISSRVRGVQADSGAGVAFEGYITAVDAPGSFTVDGQGVTVDSSTSYKYGDASGLVVGAWVEVKGSMDTASVVTASRIVFRKPVTVKIEAAVSAVNQALGTVTLMGIAVTPDAACIFKDIGPQKMKDFSLADIAINDSLVIAGFSDSGQVIARKIMRKTNLNKVTLQGPVSSVSQPTVTVLGVTVATDSQTDFEDSNEASITDTVFFSTITTGTVVRAKGDLNSATEIGADSASIIQ